MFLRNGKRKKSSVQRGKVDKKVRSESNSELNSAPQSEHNRFVNSCLDFLESGEKSFEGFSMPDGNANESFDGAWGGSLNHSNEQGSVPSALNGHNPLLVHPPDVNEEAGLYLRRAMGITPVVTSELNIPTSSIPNFSIPTTTVTPPTVNSTLNYAAPTFSSRMSQYTMANTMRLPAFPLLGETSTDRLLREMISKMDSGFRNLGTQFLQNQTQAAPPQAPMRQTFEQSAPSIPPRGMPNSDSDNISRLEQMVANLALGMNTLTQRLDTYSNSRQSPNQSQHHHHSQHSQQNANSQVPPPHSNSFTPSSHGSRNSYDPQAHVYRTLPHKWKVRFNGDNNVASVEFFIDQLTVLKESSQGTTWDHVLAVFPQFLEGAAGKWFVRYRKSLLERNIERLKLLQRGQAQSHNLRQTLNVGIVTRLVTTGDYAKSLPLSSVIGAG